MGIDHEQLLRIGKVCKEYYNQSDVKFTENDYNLWIDSLDEPMKSGFRKKGFEDCKGVLNFRRFVLELNDKGMNEFLKQYLSPEGYNYWINVEKSLRNEQ